MARLIALTFLILTAAPCRFAEAADDTFFPITPWEVPWNKGTLLDDTVNGIASLRECGYTVACFPIPSQVPECEKAGLRAVVVNAEKPVKWQELSDQQIADTVKRLIGDTAKSDAVLGYFLTDEPGAKEFPALAKAVAEVKRLAPGKIAYINLYPDYAILGATDISQLGTATYAEYLERYITEVKPRLISYDNYKVQYSQDLTDTKQAESYFSNLLVIRDAAIKRDLPFWNIVSSNQIRPGMPVPSPANLSLQAYTTLAAGAKGLTWYTYYDRGYRYAPVDKDGHRSRTWGFVRMVNEQVKILGPIMKPLKSEGVYFGASPFAAVASQPVLPGKLIRSIATDPPAPAMVGEFSAKDGAKLAMIVNLSLERTSKFTIQRTSPGSMKHISPIDGSKAAVNDNTVFLPAGQGVLLELGE